MKRSVLASVSIAVGLTALPNSAFAIAGPYTPEQAMSVLYESMRSVLGFTAASSPTDPPTKEWLSLSMVGAVVETGDQSQVNDLADFCPDPSPYLKSYARIRKLDQIYEKVLKGLTGPLRPQSTAYKNAMSYLASSPGHDSAEYTAYKVFATAYIDLDSKFLQSKDPNERSTIIQKMDALSDDWQITGFKNEVEANLGVIKTEDNNFGLVAANRRGKVLDDYRKFGRPPGDVPGSFRSPTSEFSPKVDDWEKSGGWLKMNYSEQETSSRFSSSSSQTRGWGGIALGFLNVVGSGGNGDSSTSLIKSAKDFSYQFELKRVTIRRPWLDGEVFSEPAAWTWKKVANTQKYPHIAENPDTSGSPVAPAVAVYDNKSVDCSLFPTELVIARNRTLTATVTKSDYEQITNSGSSGGGGSLFGIFGGARTNSWTTTKISEDGSNVTFKVDSPGTAVIGVISEELPRLPTPNLTDNWGDDAWIEKP